MVKKVAIFLDVSGVMVPFSPALSRKSSQDPHEGLLGLVNTIQKLATIEIILTTSLRDSYTLEELKVRFFHEKEVAQFITGKIGNSEKKAEAIDQYLQENHFDAFVIFDDSKTEGLEKFKDRFILVDGVRLLSPENVQKGAQVVRDTLSPTEA